MATTGRYAWWTSGSTARFNVLNARATTSATATTKRGVTSLSTWSTTLAPNAREASHATATRSGSVPTRGTSRTTFALHAHGVMNAMVISSLRVTTTSTSSAMPAQTAPGPTSATVITKRSVYHMVVMPSTWTTTRVQRVQMAMNAMAMSGRSVGSGNSSTTTADVRIALRATNAMVTPGASVRWLST